MRIRFFALAALALSLAACTQDEAGFLPEGAEGTPIAVSYTHLNILKEHPEINIQKLAESSGFRSRSNVIKSFTEKEGCTPGKWKKANLE